MPWQCPKCKEANLDVEISTWARLEQHDNEDFSTDVNDAQFSDHEWDETSKMQCRECGHCDVSAKFEVDSLPEYEEDEDDEAKSDSSEATTQPLA